MHPRASTPGGGKTQTSADRVVSGEPCPTSRVGPRSDTKTSSRLADTASAGELPLLRCATHGVEQLLHAEQLGADADPPPAN